MRRPRLYSFDTPPSKGDYGLTAGGGLAMLVTRIGTLSRYGHACVALENPVALPGQAPDQGTIKIIEAAPRGARVVTVPVTKFRWSNIQLTPEQRVGIATVAASAKGLPYDWAAILGFVARNIGYKLRFIGSKNRPDDKLICSELVVWAYRKGAEIDLAPGMASGDVSPGDLGDYLVSH